MDVDGNEENEGDGGLLGKRKRAMPASRASVSGGERKKQRPT